MKKFLSVLLLLVGTVCSLHADNLEKGYHGYADVGYTYNGIGYCDPSAVEIMTSHGYQFNPYVFLGAGVGFEIMSSFSKGDVGGRAYDKRDASVDIPVFFNARFNFTKKKCSPFFDGKVGAFVNNKCGLYANVSLGCRYPVGKNLGIYAAVGYEIHGAQYQELNMTKGTKYNNYNYSFYYTNEEGKSIEGITFKLGFDF